MARGREEPKAAGGPRIRRKTCEAAGKDGRDGRDGEGEEESRETSKVNEKQNVFVVVT